ncbi:MAG: TrkH family potassium uptake protein [Ignavibacteria bacterium]|jgi:trk system potassium uptake protein TrkH
MRPYVIIRYSGIILLFNSVFLLISALISFFNNDSALFPLLYSAVIAAMFGIFPIIFIPPIEDISNKEGLSIVVFSWLVTCLLGTVPYIMWGGEFSITNAWFESVSGFTTTGASVINNIEAIPMGLLFWRSSTHWIGGIGIIIFVLSVLPSMGMTGAVLYRAEMSSPAQRQFRMRAKNAVNVLVTVYLGITLIETIALKLAGMSLFDAINHTFATVATGGFSTKNSSIAAFDNLSIEIIIMIFMFLSGMNFALLFSVVTGNIKRLRFSSVFKYYALVNVLVIILVTINIYFKGYYDLSFSLRYASFQVLSIGTSTGFANADSSIWPGLSQLLIMLVTLQCACAGSTSGGIKADRILVILKGVKRKIYKFVYPNAVFRISLDKESIEEESVNSAFNYVVLYFIVALFATALLSLMDVDLLSAFSGTIAMMGNVGPGLSKVGSLANYSQIPETGKWVLSIAMLAGRLEIYGLIMIFLPAFWK